MKFFVDPVSVYAMQVKKNIKTVKKCIPKRIFPKVRHLDFQKKNPYIVAPTYSLYTSSAKD